GPVAVRYALPVPVGRPGVPAVERPRGAPHAPLPRVRGPAADRRRLAGGSLVVRRERAPRGGPAVPGSTAEAAARRAPDLPLVLPAAPAGRAPGGQPVPRGRHARRSHPADLLQERPRRC